MDNSHLLSSSSGDNPLPHEVIPGSLLYDGDTEIETCRTKPLNDDKIIDNATGSDPNPSALDYKDAMEESETSIVDTLNKITKRKKKNSKKNDSLKVDSPSILQKDFVIMSDHSCDELKSTVDLNKEEKQVSNAIQQEANLQTSPPASKKKSSDSLNYSTPLSSNSLPLPPHSPLCEKNVTSAEIGIAVLSEGDPNVLEAPLLLTGTAIFIGKSADDSLLSVGTLEGEFFIFCSRTNACIHHQRDCGGPIMLIEMLLCTSIVAVVVAVPTPDSANDFVMPMEPDESAESLEDNNDDDAPPRWTNRHVQLWDVRKGRRIAVVSFATENSLKPQVNFDHNDGSGVETIFSHPPSPSSSRGNFEAVVAVKLSHRRLVAFLDCPCAEIEVFELRTLQLITRLERNVVCVPGVPSDLLTQNAARQFFSMSSLPPPCTFSQSLAGVAALSLNPCLGYLIVPIAVPAVSLTTKSSRKVFSQSNWNSSYQIVANEHTVAAAAARGAFAEQNDQTGTVVLLDLHKGDSVVNSAQLHAHPVSSLGCNGAGTMFVSASVKGTIIRVWALPSLDLLWSWRRGSRPAQVLALEFCWSSHFVSAVTAPREWFILALRKLSSSLSQLSASTNAACNGGSRGGGADSRGSVRDEGHEISVHIFSCTKTLSPIQRKKHEPPLFPTIKQSTFAPEKEGSSEDKFSEQTSILDFEDLVIAATRKCLYIKENENTLNQHKCTWMPATSSSSSANVQRIYQPNAIDFSRLKLAASSVQQWFRSTAKSQLKSVMSDFLPGTLKAVLVDAQKAFATAKLHCPLGQPGMLRKAMLSVAIEEELGDDGQLKIQVFTASGCTLTYVCGARNGGCCQLKSERVFLYPAENSEL